MKKKILIIGGTRNIGYFLATQLLDQNVELTLLNRGVTPDDLPDHVARLRCDRTDPQQLRRAIGMREFDVVVDMTLFKPFEAEIVIDLLKGKVGHFIFVSTGQVYLVRDGITRPFKEVDYDGAVIDAPPPNTYDYEEWLYGSEKRAVEDMLFDANRDAGFPFTTLRLPMVNSERDGFKRLFGYVLRIRDGGPILLPETPNHPLRHVYAGDVVQAILRLIETGIGKGDSFNISQDETLSIDQFLTTLGDVMGKPPVLKHYARQRLEENGFLPDCSPFSDVWMSELDNARSKAELGMTYMPLRDYLANIIAHYDSHDIGEPVSYRRRHAEIKFANEN